MSETRGHSFTYSDYCDRCGCYAVGAPTECAPTETVEHGEDDIVERDDLLDIAIQTFDAMDDGRFWSDDMDAPEDERIYAHQVADHLHRLRSQEPVGYVVMHYDGKRRTTITNVLSSIEKAEYHRDLLGAEDHFIHPVGPPIGDDK